MSNITRGDFDFFRKQLREDRSIHEKMYIQRIEPHKILAYYEGTRIPGDLKNSHIATTQQAIGENDELDLSRIALNKIFPATNTVATTLYPSNPGFTAGAKREQDEFKANIAQASMNYYFEEMNALEVNQRAIINAWLFGFGVVKQGWRTVFKRKSEVSLIPGDAKNKVPTLRDRLGITSEKPSSVNVETDNDDEFVALSEPFIYSVPTSDILLDGSQPFDKGKRITHHIRRSLYDVKKSGMYDTSDAFMEKFGTKRDEREVMLDLWEKWVLLPGGWHILTMVDGPAGEWKQPLRWDKSPYLSEGNAFKLLRLNLEPDMTYPISHMAAGQRIHRQSDYILSLQLKHIRKHRSLDLFYEKALDTQTKNAIKKNEIGGYGFSSKPLAEGIHTHVGGNTIPKDLFAMQAIVLDNLQEILSVSGARAESGTKKGQDPTATRDKIAEFGNQLRTQTMQDQVNLFLKKQGIKLLQDIKQFATSPVLFKVTGLNMTNPETGKNVTEEWVEFATENNPPALKEAIQGDFDIKIDATNLARRDTGLIRQQMEQMLGLMGNPVFVQLLQSEGTQFNFTEFLKDLFGNFETISNPNKYFNQTDEEPQQEQAEPVEVGENIVKRTQQDESGNKVEETNKEKVFA